MKTLWVCLSSIFFFWISGLTEWLWFFGLAGMVPLIRFIEQEKVVTRKKIRRVWLAGFFYQGLSYSWMWSTWPLKHVGFNSGFLAGLVLLICWFAATFIPAVSFPLFYGLFIRYKKYLGRPLLMIPFVWILMEYFRAFITSVLWAGRGSMLGGHWTFGHVGYVLGYHPLLFSVVKIGGLYMAGLVVIISNLVFYHVMYKASWSRQKKLAMSLLLMATIIITGKISIHSGEGSRNIKLTLFETKEFHPFGEGLEKARKSKFETLHWLTLSEKMQAFDPDVVLYPEDASFFEIGKISYPSFYRIEQSDSELKEIFPPLLPDLKKLYGKREKLVVDSTIKRNDEGKLVSAVISLDTKTGDIFESEKSFLVPGGEYLPWTALVFVYLTGNTEWLKNFRRYRAYSRGTNIEVMKYKGTKIVAQFCNEIMSPEIFRKGVRRGAELILHISSHSMFNGSWVLMKQIYLFARARAVENGRDIAFSSNHSEAYLVDASGNFTFNDSEPPNIMNVTATARTEMTPYTRWGEWILVMAVVLLLLQLTLSIRAVEKGSDSHPVSR